MYSQFTINDNVNIETQVAIFQFVWFVKNSTKHISYGVVIEKWIKTRISLSFE
jgi:hypothetical protein